MKNSALFLIFTFALSGCATLFSSSTQKIDVRVVDSNNQLIIDHGCIIHPLTGNPYPLIGNPATVTVNRSQGGLNFICKKDGYNQVTSSTSTSVNAVTFVNILFWPGFIVDGLSGAYKNHPTDLSITMKKNT